MLRAAHNDTRVKRSVRQTQGAVPNSAHGIYGEYLIVNSLEESLMVLGPGGADSERTIERTALHSGRLDQGIDIWYREHLGDRKIIGNIESTNNKIHIIHIPSEVIYEGPIYIEEINRVLYTAAHSQSAVHPLDEHLRVFSNNEIAEIVRGDFFKSPIIITANDHLERYNTLFVEINGEIMAVAFTHVHPIKEVFDINEDDWYEVESRDDFLNGFARIEVAYNRKYVDEEGVPRRAIVDSRLLSDLFEDHPNTWKIGGIWCSLSRRALEDKLAQEQHRHRIGYISREEHLLLLEESQAVFKEELSMTKRRSSMLKDYFEGSGDIVKKVLSGDYSAKSVDMGIQKLKLERDRLRLQQAQLTEDARRQRLAQRLKLLDDATKVIASVTKTAMVVIPAVISLYAVYQKHKA